MLCQFPNVPVNQTHKHSLLQHWKFLQHINEQSLVPVPSSGKAMQANFLDSASCRQLVTTVFQPAGWWAATRWMMYLAGRSPPAVIHNLLAPIRTTTHRTMCQSDLHLLTYLRHLAAVLFSQLHSQHLRFVSWFLALYKYAYVCIIHSAQKSSTQILQLHVHLTLWHLSL